MINSERMGEEKLFQIEIGPHMAYAAYFARGGQKPDSKLLGSKEMRVMQLDSQSRLSGSGIRYFLFRDPIPLIGCYLPAYETAKGTPIRIAPEIELLYAECCTAAHCGRLAELPPNLAACSAFLPYADADGVLRYPQGVVYIAAPPAGKNGGSLPVRQVIMPDSVTAVAENAFSGWQALEEIRFSDALHTLPDGICRECPALRAVHYPRARPHRPERVCAVPVACGRTGAARVSHRDRCTGLHRHRYHGSAHRGCRLRDTARRSLRRMQIAQNGTARRRHSRKALLFPMYGADRGVARRRAHRDRGTGLFGLLRADRLFPAREPAKHSPLCVFVLPVSAAHCGARQLCGTVVQRGRGIKNAE